MEWLSVVALVILVGLIGLDRRCQKFKKLPPGPYGIPFFGSTLSAGSRPAITMASWIKRYGDVFAVFVGSELRVMVNDIETVKRVYSMDALAAKPRNTILLPGSPATATGPGLSRVNGDFWKVHRKFAMTTLRGLDAGKAWMEDIIAQDVEEFLTSLHDSNREPIDPKPRLFVSTANVICGLTFGKRFPLDDPKLRYLTGLFSTTPSARLYDTMAQTFPFLMWFSNPISRAIKGFHESRRELAVFMKDIIADFDGKSGETEDDVHDYLRAYRREQATGAITGNKAFFTEPQLLACMIDLFNGGTQPTVNTMTWVLVFLLECPNVLHKIQQEIDDNVGRNRTIRYEDRGRLPYTEATIMEVQRFACPVPLVIRVALEELQIHGHIIPKDTPIVANGYSIHHDLRYWNNPEQFDPTRFLDGNNSIIRHEAFIPFSVGKRVCPGENLAKMESFVFVANIARCFTLELPAGTTMTSDAYVGGATHTPHPFKMIFCPRDNAH